MIGVSKGSLHVCKSKHSIIICDMDPQRDGQMLGPFTAERLTLGLKMECYIIDIWLNNNLSSGPEA